MQLSKYFQSKEEVHHLWIVFFRCGVSLFALLHFGSIQADFENLFGLNAFVKPDISLVVSSEYLPTITGISHFLDIKYANLLTIIRYLYPISLLFVFIGLFSRLGAICALFLQLTLTNSIDFFCYGVDAFTTICLFYACIFPIGQFKSVDVLLFRDRKFLISTNQYLWVFQFHLCIIYFFSGFEKLLGYNWRNGESIWKIVHSYHVTSSINVDFLYQTPFFLLIGWGTVLLEMLYPIFVNIEKTRLFWITLVLTFHLSIAFFMGLYFFSTIMIIINLAGYYFPFLKQQTLPHSQPQTTQTNP